MDVNAKVVACLQHNSLGLSLLGDINQPCDRHRLHIAGGPLRCTLMSSFPCQPLSIQGDSKGAEDSRSMPFRSTLKMVWEQQMSAVILECVPKALEAKYVQDELQRLAWSMGMSLQQRILHLSRCWPCSRTRWWCIITYMPLQVDAFPDLPATEPAPVVGDLLKTWPIWPQDIETQVKLTEEEFQVYNDPRFGSDQRHLRADCTCPCILHSYGSVLEVCPCGCRLHPLSGFRLERDGVRGFYVQSEVDQAWRYLTTYEAALLLTVPASVWFPAQKLGLALLGQCAAPAQAIWTLAHFVIVRDFHAIPRISFMDG